MSEKKIVKDFIKHIESIGVEKFAAEFGFASPFGISSDPELKEKGKNFLRQKCLNKCCAFDVLYNKCTRGFSCNKYHKSDDAKMRRMRDELYVIYMEYTRKTEMCVMKYIPLHKPKYTAKPSIKAEISSPLVESAQKNIEQVHLGNDDAFNELRQDRLENDDALNDLRQENQIPNFEEKDDSDPRIESPLKEPEIYQNSKVNTQNTPISECHWELLPVYQMVYTDKCGQSTHGPIQLDNMPKSMANMRLVSHLGNNQFVYRPVLIEAPNPSDSV